MDKNYHFALRPDAQPFDEIRLVTVPRFKTSGLSGDEWRISVVAKFYRKGKVMHEEYVGHNIQDGVLHLGMKFSEAYDKAAYFAGEGNSCDQEGCSSDAKYIFKVKNEYCNNPYQHGPIACERYRKFCESHKHRGDCGFDDSDTNYELVEIL